MKEAKGKIVKFAMDIDIYGFVIVFTGKSLIIISDGRMGMIDSEFYKSIDDIKKPWVRDEILRLTYNQ